jgi:hypothetical protein
LGHRRIAGELLTLGHRIAPSTVWEILTGEWVDPALRRSGPSWKQFLTALARTVIAADFLHVETVLLKRLYVLVFIEHGTRRMHVAGITAHPDGAWTAQQVRNLAVAVRERLEEMRFLIRDRARQFTGTFDAVFEDCGLRILTSPPQAPRANAICERLVGTLRREVLDHLLMLNDAHLRTVLAEYAAHYTHYNGARPSRASPSRSRTTTPTSRPRESSTGTPHASAENLSSAASPASIRPLRSHRESRGPAAGFVLSSGTAARLVRPALRQVPLLVAAAVAIPDLQLGAQGGGPAGVVQAAA